MAVSDIATSGILEKDEHIVDGTLGSLWMKDKSGSIILVITNKRFLCITKKGILSKGHNVIISSYLNEIMSVSQAGMLSRRLNIGISNEKEKNGIMRIQVSCRNIDSFQRMLVDAKSKFVPEATRIRIEDTKIEVSPNVSTLEHTGVVEQNEINEAMRILTIRYAKGEITKDEYEDMKKEIGD